MCSETIQTFWRCHGPQPWVWSRSICIQASDSPWENFGTWLFCIENNMKNKWTLRHISLVVTLLQSYLSVALTLGVFFSVPPHLYSTERENKLRPTIELVQFWLKGLFSDENWRNINNILVFAAGLLIENSGHFLQMIWILQKCRPSAKRANRPTLYDGVLEKYFLQFCIWTFIILSASELTWDPNQGECVCATLDTAGSYPTLLTHHLHHTGKSIIWLWVRHDKGKMCVDVWG